MNKNKRIALIGALTAALAFGGAGVALASGVNADGGDAQEPSYTGSVAAPAEQDDATESATSEADESAALASLATVTPQEAEAAAVAAVPGTAGPAQLENENGYVVYGVEVTAADGSIIEVTIDAGTGDVLGQESDSDSETADDESGAGEQGEEDPQQLDGETNDD